MGVTCIITFGTVTSWRSLDNIYWTTPAHFLFKSGAKFEWLAPCSLWTESPLRSWLKILLWWSDVVQSFLIRNRVGGDFNSRGLVGGGACPGSNSPRTPPSPRRWTPSPRRLTPSTRRSPPDFDRGLVGGGACRYCYCQKWRRPPSLRTSTTAHLFKLHYLDLIFISSGKNWVF